MIKLECAPLCPSAPDRPATNLELNNAAGLQQIVGAAPNQAMIDRFSAAGFVLRDENDNVVFLERA